MIYQLTEDDLNGLFQYAMVLCQQRDDAHDLLQSAIESYLVTVKLKEKHIEKPLAYLRRMMRNRYIDHYRRATRWQTESFQETAFYDISPLDLEQVEVDRRELAGIWSELSTVEREILYHWSVLGYSTDEACRLLDMPRGSFLSRIHRLRKRCQALRSA